MAPAPAWWQQAFSGAAAVDEKGNLPARAVDEGPFRDVRRMRRMRRWGIGVCMVDTCFRNLEFRVEYPVLSSIAAVSWPVVNCPAPMPPRHPSLRVLVSVDHSLCHGRNVQASNTTKHRTLPEKQPESHHLLARLPGTLPAHLLPVSLLISGKSTHSTRKAPPGRSSTPDPSSFTSAYPPSHRQRPWPPHLPHLTSTSFRLCSFVASLEVMSSRYAGWTLERASPSPALLAEL